ncbi:hypothetical protein [Planococcus dechangensis]|uniref:Type 4 fimbrial biogenesis protein PilX N-terminal domain-containing protein n=1 Tax=Planococcus dechangensis TaxID=1176255 RepID=A0ABV9M9J7_9BACL
MRYVKNERGYALLVVLLLVVLIMSISATFMAGSINHAKQEQAVDVSNQSVAAAEMGVLYYSTDFERALDQIRQEVSFATTAELNLLVDCLKAIDISACDTQAERIAWEKDIDSRMKQLYVKKTLNKINELIKINGVKTQSFSETVANYEPQAWSLENVSYTDTELSTVNQALVNRIVDAGLLKVRVKVIGASGSSEKTLSSLFSIKIPPSFLNPGEVYNVEQKIIAGKEDATYNDIFKINPPTQSCSSLLTAVIAKNAVAPFECKMTGNEKLSDFIGLITAANTTPKLDPKDFWVHVDDFQQNVCSANCNNLDFLGTNVVVRADDTGATNNMNNLVNGNLVITGTLTANSNLNNLGKNLSKQSIVLKELNITGNIKNLNYTNLMVLGKDSGTDSRLYIGGQFQIDNYSRLCMDIDRISKPDLARLAATVEVTNSGSIVYYSSDPANVFALTGADAVNRTKLFVKRNDNYATFLLNCGIAIKSTQSVPVSSPIVSDTEFDFEVEY